MKFEKGSFATDIGSASHKCQERVAVDKSGLPLADFCLLGFEQPLSDDMLLPYGKTFLLTGKRTVGYPNYNTEIFDPVYEAAKKLFHSSQKNRYKEYRFPSVIRCGGRNVSAEEYLAVDSHVAIHEYRNKALYKLDSTKTAAMNLIFTEMGNETGQKRLVNFRIDKDDYPRKFKAIYSEVYNMLEQMNARSRGYSIARKRYYEKKKEAGLL